VDQIYRLSDVLAPAVDALLGDLTGARRSARERYAQSGPLGGRWGDVIRGWRGQAEVIRARLTKEVMATRLDRCGGQELKDLAHSEYFAEIPNEPRKALGEIIFVRSVTNTEPSSIGNFTAGVIPQGTTFKRQGDPLFVVPYQAAEYVSLQAVACGTDDDPGEAPIDLGGGNWQHLQTVIVDVEATREGPHANVPRFLDLALPPVPTVQGKLFDPLLVVQSISAAGGTLGVIDDQIRALARAMALGSNGPTETAAVAGALTNTGAHHAVYVRDPVTATDVLYVADESWSGSERYFSELTRTLYDYPWIGWGCRIALKSVQNRSAVVRPSILLRDPKDLFAASEITAQVETALRAFFDDRPDFYTWTLNAIGAVVGGADSRILACTAVGVFRLDGVLIAAVDEFGVITGVEPPAFPTASVAPHYMFFGVTPTYQLPGG